MNSINIRTLKQQTRQVMARVAMGETMEIHNHKKVVAVLQPPRTEPMPSAPLRFPDFEIRLKSLFGDRMLDVDATRLLSEERGDR
jgi:antitoxin (DNA-binding transcriptional repressor) of toxin-antitoxin stability system